jgi:hypothetical protein
VTATAVDERSLLPGPSWPPSAPPTSFPLADRRPVVLADDPCEAGSSGAGPEYAGIYLHARYFDPQLGTFLSTDPIGVEGGVNQYAYGFGDPVNWADRSGFSVSVCEPDGGVCPEPPPDGLTPNWVPGGPDQGGLNPLALYKLFMKARSWYNRVTTVFGWFSGGSGTSSMSGPNMALPQQVPPQDRGAYIPDHPTGAPADANPNDDPSPSPTPTPTPAPRPEPRRPHRDIIESRTTQWLNNELTLRREVCTDLCESGGKPFLTPTVTGTGSECTPEGCPPGARLIADGHVHPRIGGYPGFIGGDIRRLRSLRITSPGVRGWIGLRLDRPNAGGLGPGDYIWYYDPATNLQVRYPLPR